MQTFAKIENKKVVQVIVADDKRWCEENLGGTWIETCQYTAGNKHSEGGTPLRANYAGIGFTYEEERDVFYAPQPYPSWVLDENFQWQPPVARPENPEKLVSWSEEAGKWVPLSRLEILKDLEKPKPKKPKKDVIEQEE